MLKVLLILVIAYVLFEFVEHAVLPLIWLITRRRKLSPSGASGMIGEVAEVKEWKGTKGKVFVHGALWRAVCDIPLNPGEKALVLSLKGLTLKVKPFEE